MNPTAKKLFNEIQKIYQSMQQLQKNHPNEKLQINMIVIEEIIKKIQQNSQEANHELQKIR